MLSIGKEDKYWEYLNERLIDVELISFGGLNTINWKRLLLLNLIKEWILVFGSWFSFLFGSSISWHLRIINSLLLLLIDLRQNWTWLISRFNSVHCFLALVCLRGLQYKVVRLALIIMASFVLLKEVVGFKSLWCLELVQTLNLILSTIIVTISCSLLAFPLLSSNTKQVCGATSTVYSKIKWRDVKW